MGKTIQTIQLYGFLHVLPGEVVKEFIERHTGEGTVVALEFKEPKKKGSKAYVIVQFTTTRSANHIMVLG